MAEKSRKIAGDCVRIATSIIDPTIVGWNCKPLKRRVARSGGSCVNPCCFMKFITAERAMFASFYQQDKRRLRRGGSARIVIAHPQRRSAMRTGQTLSILLAAALGCQAAPPPDTTAEAKQAIDAADANWARLTAAGHADSL